MIVIIVIIVTFAACYGVVAWRRAHGGSMLDVARQDGANIKARIHGDPLKGSDARVTLPGLFTVTGRHGYHEPPEAAVDHPRTKTRRQRGGVEIGPMPEGGGRVRNPNAPCWLCGEKKTPNHKCI